MFFLRRTVPLALAAERLRGLRLSLNTPVVASADLPVGPARAAILVHEDPERGLAVTVGVRALDCGSVVLYGLVGELQAAGEGIDAALAFAEGMGFLFDDELVEPEAASREKALVRWQEAIGAGDENTASPEEGVPASPFELFELTGGDLSEPPVAARLEPSQDAFDWPEPKVPVSEVAAPVAFEPPPETGDGPPLTKFRRPADTPPEPGPVETPQERPAEAPARARAPKRQTLGRLRLARRRPMPEIQDARRGWLLRLLTSF